MKNWTSAGDKVRRRSVAAVVSTIAVQSPFLFDASADLSDVPDFLESEWAGLGHHPDIVFSLPGRDLNLTRDTLISILKFQHVLVSAKRARNHGALTWALVEAYHAALLGVRVLAAFHGVLSYTARNRTVLIDYRPEFGAKDHQKQFAREHRGVTEAVRLLRPEKEKLDQKDAWDLLDRLYSINDADASSEEAKLAERLRGLGKQPISRIRNVLLYDTVYWTWRQDFGAGPFDEEILRTVFSTDDERITLLASSLEAIVSAIQFHTTELLNQIGGDKENFAALFDNHSSLLKLSKTK